MRCMAHRDSSNPLRYLLTPIPVKSMVQESEINILPQELLLHQMHEFCDMISGVRFSSYDTYLENPPTGGPGEASLSLASRFDLLGSSGILQGFEYIEYPPFEDAPQEGDYNLLASIGKAIVAVAVVAVAVAIIGATGGLALALVGGAAVFAGCVVYSDYQNGNVSDFGTYLAAAIAGAIVGAISYMFIAQAALAIKTIAGGAQFIGLLGAQLGIPFLMTNATLLATIAGYGLAGFFGIQGANFFLSSVSGSENALLSIFFEEGSPEFYQALAVYNDVALLGNILGGGYLQEAARHMPPIAVQTTEIPTSGVDDGNYAQKTYGNKFSPEGVKKYSDLAGRKIETIDDLAEALRNGSVNPSDLPVDYIVRDGNTLILNTRTSQALEQAGIPRGDWSTVNQTGNPLFEELLTGQLERNDLTSEGTPTVRPSRGGE